jgi:hypothetical protein
MRPHYALPLLLLNRRNLHHIQLLLLPSPAAHAATHCQTELLVVARTAKHHGKL